MENGKEKAGGSENALFSDERRNGVSLYSAGAYRHVDIKK